MRDKILKIKNIIIEKIKSFDKKQITVLYIATGCITLLMLCSPMLIKNIIGNVYNIRQGSVAGVEIETPKRVLLGDPNGWDQYLGATVYNWDNFKITIKNNSGFRMTNISVNMTGSGEVTGTKGGRASLLCDAGFVTELDSGNSNTFKCYGVVQNAQNYRDVTEKMTISYNVNGTSYSDESDIAFYHAIPQLNNGTVPQNSTEPGVFYYVYTSGTNEELYQRISKTAVYMDISENLYEQGVGFSYKSNFGNYVDIKAPQSWDSSGNLYDLSLSPRLSDYFSYTQYDNTFQLKTVNEWVGDFREASEHRLWGEPTRVTNGTVKIYLPVFARYCEKNNCRGTFSSGYSRNTFDGSRFYMGNNQYPSIDVTIYNKRELANSINNAQSRLDMFPDSLYIKTAANNAIRNASDIYRTRVLSQSDIDNAVTALSSYSSGEYVPPKRPADYARLDSLVASARNMTNVTSVGGYQLYTTASWDAMQNAIIEATNVSRDYMIESQSIVDEAANKLERAMTVSDDGLVYVAGNYMSVINAVSTLKELGFIQDISNYSSLKLTMKQTTVYGKSYDLYTTESWNNLQNALNQIDTTLMANEQQKIEDFASNINTARENLEYVPAIYDVLNQTIALYDQKKTLYTDASRIPVDNFINTYNRDIKINNQNLVDDLNNNLKGLIKQLQYKPAIYAELDDKIREYQQSEGYVKNWYTDGSKIAVDNYISTIDRTKTIDKQAEVDNYLAEITALINALKLKKASYTELESKEAEYHANEKWYTEESKVAVDNYLPTIDRTKTIDKQVEVNGYVSKLVELMGQLQYKPASYKLVDDKIAEYHQKEGYKKDWYTEESKDRVDNYIASIDRNKTIDKQTEVNGYANALSGLMDQLQYKLADYTELDNKIREYQQSEAYAKEWYTDTTKTPVDNFIASIDKAKTIDKQAEVEKYLTDITELINALKLKKASYTELETKIKEYQQSEGYAKKWYTEESKTAVDNHIVSIDKNKTIDKQEEVNAYVSRLVELMGQLQYKLASYKLVDDKIKEYQQSEGYTKNWYTDESKTPVDNYIASINKTKTIDKQEEVNGYAGELTNLINQLQYKPAVYAELDNKINEYQQSEAYIKEWYTNSSKKELDDYIATIDRTKTINKQPEVEKYLTDVEGLIKALKLKKASYTEIESKEAEYRVNEGWYTKESKVAVDEYIASIDRTKTIDKQEEVNGYAAKLTELMLILQYKPANYNEIDDIIAKYQSEYDWYEDEGKIAVDSYILSIDRTKTIDKQSEVNKAAAELQDLVDVLIYKAADYTKLNELVAKLPSDYSIYSKDLQNEVKQLLEDLKKLSVDLFIFEQDEVDKMAERVEKILKKLANNSKTSEVTKNVISNTSIEVKEDKTQAESQNTLANEVIKTTKKASSTKSEKVLKYIKINGETIDFTKQNAKITVEASVSSVDVEVALYNNKYKYEVYGGQKLTYGDNEVTIIVTNNLKEHYAYKIIVNRKRANSYLNKLEIENFNITFDKRKTNYIVKVDKKTKQLKLKVVAESKNSKISIKGNNNLKNGSKVIIKVKGDDGSSKTYTLKIQKPSSNITLISIVTVMGLLSLAGALKYIIIRKQQLMK